MPPPDAVECRCGSCDCDAFTQHPDGVCWTCRAGDHHVHRYGDRLAALDRIRGGGALDPDVVIAPRYWSPLSEDLAAIFDGAAERNLIAHLESVREGR